MNVLEAAWDHALYFHLIVCDNNLHLRQKGLSSALDLVVCFCGFVGWVFVYLCFVVLVGFFFFFNGSGSNRHRAVLYFLPLAMMRRLSFSFKEECFSSVISTAVASRLT